MSRAWFSRVPMWDDCDPIFHAVDQDGLPALREYVNRGGSLRVRGPLGGTLTLFCAYKNDLDSLRFLVQHGAKLGLRNPAGQSELHYAAIDGNVILIKFLIRHGVKLLQADIDGTIPLHLCVLIPESRKHFQAIRELVKAGTPVDFPNRKNGRTALQYAVLSANPATVKLLLKLGADPGIKNRAGESAIDLAMKPSTLKWWKSMSLGNQDWYLKHAEMMRSLLQSSSKSDRKGISLNSR